MAQESMRAIQQRVQEALGATRRVGQKHANRLFLGGRGRRSRCSLLRGAPGGIHRERGPAASGATVGGAMDLGTNALVRTASACPSCGTAHEDEAQVLWAPWLLTAAAAIPQPPPPLPEHSPACPRRAGVLPARLSEGPYKALVDAFLYHLYNIYLLVLAEHMPATTSVTARGARRGSVGDTPGPTSMAPRRACHWRSRSACNLACRAGGRGGSQPSPTNVVGLCSQSAAALWLHCSCCGRCCSHCSCTPVPLPIHELLGLCSQSAAALWLHCSFCRALLVAFVQRTVMGTSVARPAWCSWRACVARFLCWVARECTLHRLRGRPPCTASAGSALDVQHSWLYSATMWAWCRLLWGLGPLAGQGATCVFHVAPLLCVIVASQVVFW